MSQGKRLQTPVYLLTDTKRPSPNYLVDSNGHASTLYAWTTMKLATEYAVDHTLRKFDIIIINSAQEFRGILSGILDRGIEWLHWDPSEARRTPRRFKIEDVLNVTSKENG